jgi:hypothetical protein
MRARIADLPFNERPEERFHLQHRERLFADDHARRFLIRKLLSNPAQAN